MRQSWYGVALVLVSSIAFSSAGYFTRLIPIDVWTMLFWRCLFGGFFIAGCVVAHHGRGTIAAVRSLGATGLLIALCSTISTICFINALRLTSVADVNVIFATAPFVSAGLAWAFAGARESRTTLGASLVALLGVALMVGAGSGEGHWSGDLLALVMTVLLAAMMVMIRHRKPAPALPAASLSAFLAAFAVLPWARPLAVNGPELTLLLVFGTTQFGAGLALLTLGTRLISATRAALLSSLELPFAVAWVWIGLHEIPTSSEVTGAAVVMAAVLGDLLLRRRKPA